MKKLFKILGGLFALILLALFLIPYFFKDKLVEKIKEEANAQLNAKLTFEDVDLTFFAHFPKLTLELKEFKISGINQFEGVDLVDIQSLELTIGLAKLFKGEMPDILDIYLISPKINTQVDALGAANWDIVKESTEAEMNSDAEDSSEAEDFKIALKHYKIVDGWISYSDKSGGILFVLENLQHEGSGDFGASNFNLSTTSIIDNMILEYEGEKYIDHWKLDAKIDISVDLDAFVFVFSDNEISINDLLLNMEGSIAMPDSSIDFDLLINAPSFDLKQMISLFPPEYTKDLDGFAYKGTSKLSSWIKGSYSDNSYPLFALDMSVNNGSLQHKDLPKSIKDVEIKAHVELPDAYDLDQLWIEISKFNLDLGGNPISSAFSLHKPMTSMYFDALLSASVNLSTLKEVLPSEDAETYSGIINVDLQANGSLDEIAKENYSNLNSSGKLLVNDMNYNASSLSTPIFIDRLLMDFNMNEVNMEVFNARIGQSDFAASGQLRDFIPYVLLNKVIYAELNLQSNFMNIDELMNLMLEDSTVSVADSSAQTTSENISQSSDSIVPLLPKNIHFKAKAGIDKLKYDSYELEAFKGDLELENGILNLLSSSAKILGSDITMSGKFDESIPAQPLADFDFSISGMNIKAIGEMSPLVLKYAPICKYTSGTFSGKIRLKTSLDTQWNPIYNTVYSKGNIKTKGVKIEGFKPLEDLAAITKTEDILHKDFENMDIEYEIIDGKGYIKPFEFKIDQLKGASYGTIDLEQNINFDVNMAVPTVMLGSAANQLMGQLAGTLSGLGLEAKIPEKIQMDIKITGTVDKPIIKPNFSGSATSNVKEIIKEQIQEEIEKVKEEVLDRASEEADKILADARIEADRILKEAQKNIDLLKKEGYAQADKLVSDAKGPIEKVAAKAAAVEMKKQVDKQAVNLMNEAKKKSDKVLQDAQNQADRLKN